MAGDRCVHPEEIRCDGGFNTFAKAMVSGDVAKRKVRDLSLGCQVDFALIGHHP